MISSPTLEGWELPSEGQRQELFPRNPSLMGFQHHRHSWVLRQGPKRHPSKFLVPTLCSPPVPLSLADSAAGLPKLSLSSAQRAHHALLAFQSCLGLGRCLPPGRQVGQLWGSPHQSPVCLLSKVCENVHLTSCLDLQVFAVREQIRYHHGNGNLTCDFGYLEKKIIQEYIMNGF